MSDKKQDKQLGKEESFKEWVRTELKRMDDNGRSMSMNLGAVCRALGMSPKTFVKALYDDGKNREFYINTLQHEQKRMQKLQGNYIPWYKKIFKRKENMARKPFGSNQSTGNPTMPEHLDTVTQAKVDEAKVTLANAPESATPVKYDGLEVTAILQDGKSTPTHYHCSMSNGTTMHVPKTLWS